MPYRDVTKQTNKKKKQTKKKVILRNSFHKGHPPQHPLSSSGFLLIYCSTQAGSWRTLSNPVTAASEMAGSPSTNLLGKYSIRNVRKQISHFIVY